MKMSFIDFHFLSLNTGLCCKLWFFVELSKPKLKSPQGSCSIHAQGFVSVLNFGDGGKPYVVILVKPIDLTHLVIKFVWDRHKDILLYDNYYRYA